MYQIKLTPMHQHINGGIKRLAFVSDPMKAIARFQVIRLQLLNDAPIDMRGVDMECGGIGYDYRLELNECTMTDAMQTTRNMLRVTDVVFFEWNESFA